MKKIIALALVAFLALGVFTACGKKNQTQPSEQAATQKAAQEGYQSVKAVYKDKNVTGSLSLPAMGGIEEDPEDYEGVGNNFLKIYGADEETEYVYIGVDLGVTVCTEDYKNEALSGQREPDFEVKKMQINGLEAAKYDESTDSSRRIEYFVYSTTKEGEIAEFSIYLEDNFMDFTDAQWQQVVEAVESSAAIEG